jgi:hypothetical protein
MFFLRVLLLFAVADMIASPLLERLEKARPGDFVVFEADQMVSLLAVRAVSCDTLILEEISAPSIALQNKKESWGAWISASAPGHTSWSMVEIDIPSRQIVECYSFSKAAWITVTQQGSLLTTLLQLPLAPIQEERRRKVGPPPQDGEVDRRPAWNPPLVASGELIQNAVFDVFEATWPTDNTELSGKIVSLYFDRAHLSFFPSWVQIENAYAAASLRAIDSGKNLPALFRSLPRRVPEFVAPPQKTEQGIRLCLRSPKYYKTFELFAVDTTTRQKQLHPIAHQIVHEEGEIVVLEVSAEQLNQILLPDHKYTWLVVPSDHAESYAESARPFSWGSYIPK